MLENNLKEARLESGLSQAQAAKEAGISQSLLAMMEIGTRRGSDYTKLKLAVEKDSHHSIEKIASTIRPRAFLRVDGCSKRR